MTVPPTSSPLWSRRRRSAGAALESAAAVAFAGAASAAVAARSRTETGHAWVSDDDEEDGGEVAAAGTDGGAGDLKKVKRKKPKVIRSSSKIVAADLAAFLGDIAASRGGRGRGRGRFPPCRYCHRTNHTADRCYSKPANALPSGGPSYHQAPVPAAHMVAYDNSVNTPPFDDWYPDTGATHHVTADLNRLSLATDYKGLDRLRVGNGNGLPIAHTGSTTFASGQGHGDTITPGTQ